MLMLLIVRKSKKEQDTVVIDVLSMLDMFMNVSKMFFGLFMAAKNIYLESNYV